MGTSGSSGQQVSGWQTVKDGMGGMVAQMVSRWHERVQSGMNEWGTVQMGTRVGDSTRARAGTKGCEGVGHTNK